MRLEWLDDLIALAECESLTLAAERRNLSQSAFSRRLQVIENWLGMQVVDRTKRPMQITAAVSHQLNDIRSLAVELRRVRSEMQSWESNQPPLVIACQHTLGVALFPKFIAQLREQSPKVPVKLRSGNRDQIFSLLMTRQADLLVSYETDTLQLATDDALIEKITLLHDQFIPVCGNQYNISRIRANEPPGVEKNNLDLIAYPPEVFFGAIIENQILPALRENNNISIACETALVPAVFELVRAGIGVAWLPALFAQVYLDTDEVQDLSERYGFSDMRIVAARLKSARSSLIDSVWTQLLSFAT